MVATALVFGAVVLVTRPTTVEEFGLQIDLPSGCSSNVGNQGTDTTGVTYVVFLDASAYSSDSCLEIEHGRAQSLDDMLRTIGETPDSSAKTDSKVSTPCGVVIQEETRYSTTYAFEHAGTSWVVSFWNVPDTMSSCRFVTP
jgi:hypothetical protein